MTPYHTRANSKLRGGGGGFLDTGFIKKCLDEFKTWLFLGGGGGFLDTGVIKKCLDEFKTWLSFSNIVKHLIYLLGIYIPRILGCKHMASLIVFSSTGRDQSSLCDTPLSVCLSVRPSVCPSICPSVNNSCYRISSEAFYHRDFFIVPVCWPFGVVVHLRL